jgi:hypothetical protein
MSGRRTKAWRKRKAAMDNLAAVLYKASPEKFTELYGGKPVVGTLREFMSMWKQTRTGLSPQSQRYTETRADEIARAKKRREFKKHAEAIGRGEAA